jgi:serine/threonine-protein kinase
MAVKSHPDERFRSDRAFQRCPNCDVRADVSLHVAGALIRCAHCNVRFEVARRIDAAANPQPSNPHAPDDPSAWEELAAVGNPNPPPSQKPSAGAQARGSPPNQPRPMPLIDGFALLERLGQGGMGEVFRCTRIADGREIAVKVLSEALAVVPDYVRRFDREAAAMAQLDHPGIVRLLSRGRCGEHCYIVMELVPGPSLRAWVAQARPSSRALARLLAQVAHALAYAHARGVVHRDLKPDNVLVVGQGRTKVLDFGLAGLHAEGAQSLTQSNVAMGTANYMAPEQRKDAHRADHRADLYSFGVMMYELLTGELPAGKYPAASKVVPGLGRGWDALIERCLEQDPAARPHSALELAHALESLAGALPMQLAPRTRRAQRSRLWSFLGIGGGLAIALGLAGLRVARDHSPRLQARLSRSAASLRLAEHRNR